MDEKIKGMETEAAIEAMLFIWGEPLEAEEMAKAIGCSLKEVQLALECIERKLNASARGLCLKCYDGAYQLQTKEQYAPILGRLIPKKKERRMSPQTLETLAIIAYEGPITRVEIEQIRGVSTARPISVLEEKGLIEEAGRLDRIGRPILYRTTRRFLEMFDLKDLDALPRDPGDLAHTNEAARQMTLEEAENEAQ